MELAKHAAPEIDRLVWTVNRGVAPRHGARLSELAAEIGLDSLEPFPITADFLLAGTASLDLITRRMPYSPAAGLVDRFGELTALGLIERRNGTLVATDRLAPLLETMRKAAASVAAENWSGHEQQVANVEDLARQVALAASADHVVAVAHRELPAPDDPYLRLYDRLVTLRYIRQHDHVVAWQQKDLTAPAIVALTKLWYGDEVAADDAGLPDLVDRGLVYAKPVVLSDAGRVLREAIEEDTNRRSQQTFDVLDGEEGATLLAVLRSLPGSGMA